MKEGFLALSVVLLTFLGLTVFFTSPASAQAQNSEPREKPKWASVNNFVKYQVKFKENESVSGSGTLTVTVKEVHEESVSVELKYDMTWSPSPPEDFQPKTTKTMRYERLENWTALVVSFPGIGAGILESMKTGAMPGRVKKHFKGTKIVTTPFGEIKSLKWGFEGGEDPEVLKNYFDYDTGIFVKALAKNPPVFQSAERELLETNIDVAAVGARYTLSTSKDPPKGGSLTFDPSGNTFEKGAEVTVIAKPAEGYEFDHWEGDYPAGKEESKTITVKMDSDKSLTAHFVGSTEIKISNTDVEMKYEGRKAIKKFFTEKISYSAYIEADITNSEEVKKVVAKINYASLPFSEGIVDKIFKGLGLEDRPSEIELSETETPGHFRGEFSLKAVSFKDKIEMAKIAHTIKDVKGGLLSAVLTLLPTNLVTVDRIVVTDSSEKTYIKDVNLKISSIIDAGVGYAHDEVYAHCPVDLLVEDGSGRRIGVEYKNGEKNQTVNEFDNAIYSGPESEVEFIIIFNSNEKYQISAKGTGEGKMDLKSCLYSEEGKISYSYPEIPTSPNSKADVTLNKSKISGTNYRPNLSLDNNGDGTAEKRFSPQVTLLSKSKSREREIPVIWIGVGAVIVVGVVVALLARR